ncbi:MAG: 3-methyl-2-oxobutanoate hydroxymethyltransferase [Pseudomonadota bacterium]
MNKITIKKLKEYKAQQQKFAVLTAYDASFSRTMESCEIDAILVGDSLGNVVQGHNTTVPVTMSDMCYHTRCVSRSNQHSFIIADLPYMAYSTPEQTLENATQLMQAGAHMVKLEGGDWLLETVAMLTERGIPVCGHLGLTPQSVNAIGAFQVQGKTSEEAEQLMNEAINLTNAGISLLVLECVPSSLGKKVTESLSIPTIGIGAGSDTDAQVLVIYDILGISPGRPPKFVKNFLEESGSISGAISAYKSAVEHQTFPDTAHQFLS